MYDAYMILICYTFDRVSTALLPMRHSIRAATRGGTAEEGNALPGILRDDPSFHRSVQPLSPIRYLRSPYFSSLTSFVVVR